MSNQPQHGERPHSSISPSGFEARDPRYGGCLGYKDRKVQFTNQGQEQGEALHELLDRNDLDTILNDPLYLGLDDNDKALIDFCLDLVKVYSENESQSLSEIITEPQLEIVPVNDDEMMYGYVDRVHIYESRATIFDWKFGWIEVTEAELNWQGKLYAVGLLNERPDLEEVTVVFVQPKLGNVANHTIKRGDLPKILSEARTILAGAQQPDSEKQYSPDPVNCSRCGNTTCPVLVRSANELSQTVLKEKATVLATIAALEGTPVVATIFPQTCDPEKMNDPREISKALDIADVMTTWAQEIKAKALETIVEKGLDVPGRSLRFRKPTKKILDVQEVYQGVNRYLMRGGDTTISKKDFVEGAMDLTNAGLARLMKKIKGPAMSDYGATTAANIVLGRFCDQEKIYGPDNDLEDQIGTPFLAADRRKPQKLDGFIDILIDGKKQHKK